MTCPGCGGRTAERLFRQGDRLFHTTARTFEVCRCADCALEYLWPQPAPEELPAFYPDGYWVGPSDRQAGGGLRGRAAEWYRRLVLFDHVRFVGAVVRAQQRAGIWRGLLDVGCGDGSFLEGLGARPSFGLDWSAGALRAVRARGFPALRADPLRAPLREGAFSIVTMFHFLEHVTPAAAYLDAVRRLLAPGGRLIVQVPNVGACQRRLLGSRWAGYDVPRHLVDYSTRTLRATLERNAFGVRRVTQFSLRDNPTTLANSLAPGLYPPARASRTRAASRDGAEWLANLAYLGLVLAGLPFTLLESALGHGAAVMMEAEPVAPLSAGRPPAS